jgi:hypothetical protein
MAKVFRLHPKVREKVDPQMSAAALAEYLIMKPDQQETVLHNSRFTSGLPVTPHQQAIRPIQAYCSDIRRPKSLLDAAKADLKRSSADHSIRPKGREESLRCLESIELFELAENAFGLNKLPLEMPPKFEVLQIQGVRVSVQPHLLARASSGKFGTVFFRPQKAPDPEDCRLEETRRTRGDHRREMARYMLALAKMAMDELGADLGSFEKSLSFVADIRLGERIDFSTTDNAARVRAIKAACKQIRTLWDDIEPRPSALAKD